MATTDQKPKQQSPFDTPKPSAPVTQPQPATPSGPPATDTASKPAAPTQTQAALDVFRHLLPFGLGDKLPGGKPKEEPKPGVPSSEDKGQWGWNPFSGLLSLSGSHNETDKDGNKSGVNGSGSYNYKTGEGSAKVGGKNGDDSGSMEVDFDKDGISKFGGAYNYENKDGQKFGLTGNIRRDGFGGGVTTGGKNWGLGFNYDVTMGKIEQDAAAHGGDLTASMLGGDYISTTRTDSVSLGVNASFKGVGVNAGMNSGSKIEIIESMDPAKWRDMKESDKQAYLAQQQAALTNYKEGLAGVDLLAMQAGTGVHVTSFNGWNAGGGLTLGAVGVNGGIGQSTAHDVTIVRPTDPNAPIMVNVGRQDGLSVNGGVDIAGVGLGFKNDTTNTKQTQFSIDPKMMEIDPQTKLPKHPETYEAVQTFLQTGLMPGAGNLKDPAAQKAYEQFGQARKDVEALNAQIAEAQKKPASDPAAQAELQRLLTQLNSAQSKIDLNRNYLNDQWQTENGAGKEPVPGVKVQGRDDNKDSEFSASVAGFQIGKVNESWMSREYWSTKGTIEQQYGYAYQNWFLGNKLADFSTQSDTNTSGTMLGMHSGKNLGDDPEMLALASGIDRGTAGADFMVNDKYFRDHAQYSLTIELNQGQLMGMANSMNDMSNPDSKALWADFGSRTSAFLGGDKYWEDMDEGVLKNSLIGSKEKYDESRDFVRRDWLEQTFAKDGAGDPVAAALHSFGKTQEEAMKNASARFSSVKSPAEFQKLSPQEQQLFMAILDQTSGGEDFTGKHSGYEGMACVALINDPKTRADSMNKLVADCNDTYESHFNDAGWDFVKFAERFKTSDPATYNLIKQGMRLDFTTDELKSFEAKNTQDVMSDIKNAYNCKWAFWQDIDPQEDTIVNGMLALMERQDPNAKPGTAITQMVQETGMDPVKVLEQFPADKPALRQMYIDMMMQTPYAADIKAVVDAQQSP